jgi:hypothetical protein
VRGPWIAGGVRARGMLGRTLGPAGRAELAARPSLEDALRRAAGSGYGADLRTARTLEQAERALGATALWNLRVLAGWLAPGGAEVVRVLAGWFEIANVDAVIAALVTGAEPPLGYALGGLRVASAQVMAARTLGDVRAALAASAWGDPGGDGAQAIRRGLVAAWARRVLGSVPEARAWVAGAGALMAARELFVVGGAATGPRRTVPGLPDDSLAATTLGELRALLPADAAWALDGVDAPDVLWEAELRWWRRVEADAAALAAAPVGQRAGIVGAATMLLVDARETARALAVASRGGEGRTEVALDAAA